MLPLLIPISIMMLPLVDVLWAVVRRTARGRRAVIGVNIGKSKATALEDAADDAHAALATVEGLTLRWTPLSRDPSR